MSDESSTATAVVAAPANVATVTQTPATTVVAASTGSAVSEPWQKDFIASDYSLNPKSYDRLPDHLKGMKPTLEKYKTFEDLLVGFQNQQVMAGKKALAPLPADAPAAAVAERRALMATINGVPADAKGYGIVKPADLPDVQWNQTMADSYAAWAHKWAVSPTAAKELMATNMATVKTQLQAQAQEETAFWNKEQQTFEGKAKESNIAPDRAQALVEKGALALGLDLTREQTKNFLKGSDARLMAMRHAIAIGEDKAVTGASSGNEGGDAGALAKAAVSDPSNPLYAPYWNKGGTYSRSDHDAAVERVNGWRRIAAEKAEKR